MASVWFGSPLSRTTRTASATTSPTASPVPSGVTENATSTALSSLPTTILAGATPLHRPALPRIGQRVPDRAGASPPRLPHGRDSAYH